MIIPRYVKFELLCLLGVGIVSLLLTFIYSVFTKNVSMAINHLILGLTCIVLFFLCLHLSKIADKNFDKEKVVKNETNENMQEL